MTADLCSGTCGLIKQERELQGQRAALESIATASLRVGHDPRPRLRDPKWNRQFMEVPRGMPDSAEGEQRWWADQRLMYLRMGAAETAGVLQEGARGMLGGMAGRDRTSGRRLCLRMVYRAASG